MGRTKDLFGQMREQGHDLDCSGNTYNEYRRAKKKVKKQRVQNAVSTAIFGIIFVAIVLFLIFSCSPTKKVTQKPTNNSVIKINGISSGYSKSKNLEFVIGKPIN